MESLPITQVKNKIISTRRERKCSHNCVRSPSSFFFFILQPFLAIKPDSLGLKTPSQNDVRQEQSFFGDDARVQMNNDPIIPTPWREKRNAEDIGTE